MAEIENATLDTNEEVGLFDDVEDTTQLSENEEQTEEKAEETQQDDEGADDEIPYTFLGKEGKISRKEITADVIQKSLNHDHVVAENARLKAQYEETQKALNEKNAREQIADLVASGNYSEDEAKEFVRLKQFEADTLAKEQALQSEKTQEETRKGVLNDFIAEYPDVKPSEWSEAMKEAYAKGENILNIYVKEENARLKTQLQADKTNKKNEDKSIGSIDTTKKTVKVDDFVSGLFG